MRNQRFVRLPVLALLLPVILGLGCGLKRDWNICAPDDKQPCLPGYVCTADLRCVMAGDGGSDALVAPDSHGPTDAAGGGLDGLVSAGTDGPGGAGSDTAGSSALPDAAVGTSPGLDGSEPDRAPAAVSPDAPVGAVPDAAPVASLPDAPLANLPDAPPVGSPPDVSIPDAPIPDAPIADARAVDAPGTCAADKDCPAESPLCLSNRCAKCAGDNDCTGRTGTPVCAASGLCVACTSGSKQCSLLQPQLCSAVGQWQNSGLPCSTLCNGGTCAACAPGAQQCNGSQPQTCNPSGTWQNTGNACSGCYTCSTATGTCVANTGASCDDGNACTQTDTCQSGVCVGSNPKTCPAPATCRGAGTCDPSTGTCNYPLAANNSSCSDGNACTQYDSCQGGTCVGTPITCAATTCHAAGTCSAGTCSQGSPVADGTTDPTCPSSANKCYSGTCVQCLTDQHCSAPTPSCDPTSHTCVCRKPSSGNLLKNPGFDGSLSGWTVYTATLAADSEGCSGSNSGYVDNDEADPEQCVPLTGGAAYYFGGKFKGGYAGNFFRLRFFTGANCAGTGDNTLDLDLVGSTDWAPLWMDLVAPSGTTSVRVGFYGMQQYFDQLYLNVANQF